MSSKHGQSNLKSVNKTNVCFTSGKSSKRSGRNNGSSVSNNNINNNNNEDDEPKTMNKSQMQ